MNRSCHSKTGSNFCGKGPDDFKIPTKCPHDHNFEGECICYKQILNILRQLVGTGARIRIRTENDGSKVGIPTSIFENGLVVLNESPEPGRQQAVNICESVSVSLLGTATFEELGVEILNINPTKDSDCEGKCERAVRLYLSERIGERVSLDAGGITFNGEVTQVGAGIVLLGNLDQRPNEEPESDVAISTCDIAAIR